MRMPSRVAANGAEKEVGGRRSYNDYDGPRECVRS